jgi:asparaginyl-tRNA synthetase
MTYKSIISITSEDIGSIISIRGWVETARFSAKTAFLKVYDSWRSHLAPLQIVFDLTKMTQEAKSEFTKITSSCSISVTGTLVSSPKPAQPFELQGTDFKILGIVTDPATFPIAKAELTMEHLRTHPHLECFSQSKSAIYGIRSLLLESFEKFFREHEFTKTDMPLITFSECEGGCQPMQATLLLTSGDVSDIPVLEKSSKVDFTKDFFGSKASLTVSSQLELETHLPLGKVWTMTRAIRGEPSATSRHLAEFSMLEIELPFIESAKDVSDMSEKLIVHSIHYIMSDKYGALALEMLSKKFAIDIKQKLTEYTSKPFQVITHRDAVTLLFECEKEKKVVFEKSPDYSDDMSTEHERYLTDAYFKHPVIITQYPKEVKAFYMPVVGSFTSPTSGKHIEYVDCFDILVPGVGELIGGSARIDEYAQLMERIDALGLEKKPLEFYSDLRKYGSVKHGGMGMGFERLMKFITFVESVKDCVAYPRFFRSGK